MATTQRRDRSVEQETTERAEREEMFTIHPEIFGAAGPMPRRVDGDDEVSVDDTAQ